MKTGVITPRPTGTLLLRTPGSFTAKRLRRLSQPILLYRGVLDPTGYGKEEKNAFFIIFHMTLWVQPTLLSCRQKPCNQLTAVA